MNSQQKYTVTQGSHFYTGQFDMLEHVEDYSLEVIERVCEQAMRLFDTISDIGFMRKSRHDFERRWFRIHKGVVPRLRKFISTLPKEKRKAYGIIIERLNTRIIVYNRHLSEVLVEDEIDRLFEEKEDPNLKGRLRVF